MFAAAATRSKINTFLGAALGHSPAPRVEVDERTAVRRQAALTAEVVSAGGSYVAQIRSISTGGITLGFTRSPALYVGAQLLVRAPGFAPFTGSVRWVGTNECGLAFNVALAEDMLNDETVLFDPGKRARPGRVKIKLPAIARAPGLERKVTVENIGAGGAQISSGLPLPLTEGRGLMLEIEGALPIGSYVRWRSQGRYGLMFSKLLPIATAEEIADRCTIHRSWLNEVRAAHSAVTTGNS